MRRIGYRDPETGQALVFLTNNFTVPALTIAKLYRGRWQIERFFKATSAHQSLLRHLAKRGAHSNLDRHRRLSARCHFEKASASGGYPRHNFTDFKPHAF
jgi:IS4 transposase